MNVGMQKIETPSILNNRSSLINSATSMHEENKTLKLNQENVASMITGIHATMKPYPHSNHKKRNVSHLKYQHSSKVRKLTTY